MISCRHVFCKSALNYSNVFMKMSLKLSSNVSTSSNEKLSEYVLKEVFDDDIFLIGINRPSKRNCVNSATARQLLQAFSEFEANDCKVAVLYGKGGNFCAGFDLSEVATSSEIAKLNELAIELKRPMGPSMMQFSKPVIAAIDGYAVAGGLELALMCDLRVCEDTAKLGVFCRRFGVPLLDGGTVRLPKLIGLSRALDLILTGREVDASEAFRIGLVNKIVETGTALGHAVQLSRIIKKFPQECLKADRRSAYYSAYDAQSIDDAFTYEWKNGFPIVKQESISGAQKFVEHKIGRHGSFNLFKSKL